MKTKKIELKDITNKNSFYKIVCGDLVIGSLKRSSINKWIIFPELPNFKHMVICSDMDEGLSLMEEKLTEFVNITTTENDSNNTKKEFRVSY
jgi:hypothetical protein